MLGLSVLDHAQTKTPAAEGFDRLKALEGDWIDVDGIFGTKAAVAVTYADEIRGTWDSWEHGKGDHSATFRVVRKK